MEGLRLFLVVVLAQSVVASPQPLVDQDAYAVYGAVIPSTWPVRVAHATRLVIQDTTESGGQLRPCYPEGPDVDNGTWAAPLADFKKQNAHPLSLVAQFPLVVRYDLVRRDDIQSIFKTRGVGGWDEFNAMHPDAHGYIQVSAVGFDAEKTKAIVYVAHHCGGLCGAGNYHFLQRDQDGWRKVRPNVIVCTWIS